MSQQPPVERTPKIKETNEHKALPVLPVRDTVLFPHAVLPLTVGRESSVQLINSLGEDKTIIVVAQREARVDTPQPTDLYTVGTSAVVHKVVKMPNQSLFVFAEGLERVRLGEFTQLTPFMSAHYSALPEGATPLATSEIEALQRNVLTLFQQIVAGSPTSVGRTFDRGDEHRRTRPPGGLHRIVVAVAVHARQAGHAGDSRHPRAAGEDQPAPGQGTRSPATAQQDSERSAGPGAADAARVLPARADEGDPERTGRAGRRPARRRRPEEENRRSGHARRGEERSAQGTGAALAHVADGCRLFADPQLH